MGVPPPSAVEEHSLSPERAAMRQESRIELFRARLTGGQHPINPSDLPKRFARRHGYDHRRPEEKDKLYVRFEMLGPGTLVQHDASQHCWLPALEGQHYLLLTPDDYSRHLVGALLVPRETSWTPLQVVRQTVQAYGRPLADLSTITALFAGSRTRATATL